MKKSEDGMDVLWPLAVVWGRILGLGGLRTRLWNRSAARTALRLRRLGLAGGMWLGLSGFTAEAAVKPAPIRLPDGFVAEQLYSVDAKTQGSWVTLAVDDRGRLITSDQHGKLFRITIQDDPTSSAQPPRVSVVALQASIGHAQGLLHAFGYLYVMVNGDRSGVYRLRDTDGNDQYDRVERLLPLDGNGEHGPHALVLGPDKKSIYVCCGNHTKPPKLTASRLPQVWDEDLLLPRMWDATGHAVGKLAPGGFILRMDPDAKQVELIAAGFRNHYDLAFDTRGEMFTYDADMEWDIGLPWYRPTRIVHVLSGAELGWRSGSGKWPSYYPDSVPAIVDIGPGSPTGTVFGTGARFPARYQRALFAADWSFGVIYAVHLEPSGASFQGVAERFAVGTPFPVCDMVVRPQDGALYLVTGGRRVQSALYRIRYSGGDSVEPAADDTASAEAPSQRHWLESLHVADPPDAVSELWPYLSHTDRALRYAARVALEHQPLPRWLQRVQDARHPDEVIQCAIALSRLGQVEQPRVVLEMFRRLDLGQLSRAQMLDLVRACGLVFVRVGPPDEALRAEIAEVADRFYPAKDPLLNRELCQLLVYLRHPAIVPKTLQLVASATSQEDRFHYLTCLRVSGLSWTEAERRTYLEWLADAAANYGGHSYAGFVRRVLEDAVASMSEDERQNLAEAIAAASRPAPAKVYPPRDLVQPWTVDELLTAWDALASEPDRERGRLLFDEAQCFQCHRFQGQGSVFGPDLSGVSGRFSERDLLTAVVAPESNISDQYQMTQFLLKSGRVVTGRIVNLSEGDYQVAGDLRQPDNLTTVRAAEIEALQPSSTSAMPSGLLDTFTAEEVRDLMSYLRGSLEQPAE